MKFRSIDPDVKLDMFPISGDQVVHYRVDITKWVYGSGNEYSECIENSTNEFRFIADPTPDYMEVSEDESEAISDGDIDYEIIVTIYDDNGDVAEMSYSLSDALNDNVDTEWIVLR